MHVQNAAAHVVKDVHGRKLITPILRELHWLSVAYWKRKTRDNEFRIPLFKVNTLTFKGLRGLAPTYLEELFVPYTPARSMTEIIAIAKARPPHCTPFQETNRRRTSLCYVYPGRDHSSYIYHNKIAVCMYVWIDSISRWNGFSLIHQTMDRVY